jgi:hypothetical protein
MSFGLYSAGFAIVIVGLAYAAHLVHVPMQWILVGAVVMIGVAFCPALRPRASETQRADSHAISIFLASAVALPYVSISG